MTDLAKARAAPLPRSHRDSDTAVGRRARTPRCLSGSAAGGGSGHQERTERTEEDPATSCRRAGHGPQAQMAALFS
jgi:hypothetical protein